MFFILGILLNYLYICISFALFDREGERRDGSVKIGEIFIDSFSCSRPFIAFCRGLNYFVKFIILSQK